MDFKALSKLLAITGVSLLLTACGSEGESDSRVVISYGDTILILNDLQYQLPIVVQVADSDGSPQANISVSIKLTTTEYRKGYYTYTGDTDGDGNADRWVKAENHTCSAEDTNNNIILDAGEDTNFNGQLDPDTPTITSHPDEAPTLISGTSTIITDENGFGYFTLSYPKTQATWVIVLLEVSADDGLPENRGIFEFRIPGAREDFLPEDDAPAFIDSPYGFSPNCADNF